MGQVFTWPEVEAGRVPTPNDFTVVLQILRNKLSQDSSVAAALVCGSVIRGDPTRRSDIDYAAISEVTEQRRADALMQSLTVLAHQYHVPLSFIPCDTAIVRTRMHHYGPSFTEHLRRSAEQGGLVKGKLFELIAQSVSLSEETENYLRFKMHELQRGWIEYPVMSPDRKAALLRKMLEAPLHVARKTLARLGPLQGDSKLQIRTQYTQCMPGSFAARLGELVRVDGEYSTELARQLQKPNASDYKTMLGYLEEQVPTILEFVRWNLLHVATTPR